MRKVRIVNDGVNSHSAKIFDAETGVPIQGVQSIQITYTPDDWVKAEVCLGSIETDATAVAEFVLLFVENGVVRKKLVKQITLADGTVLDF